MRAAAVALAALLLVGCTGDGAKRDVVQGSPTSSSTPSPTSSASRGVVRMLALGDIPPGYQIRSEASLSPQPVPPPMAPPACAHRPPVEKVPQASRVFARTPSLIVENVTVYDSADEASRNLHLRAPHPACPSATILGPDQKPAVVAVPKLVPVPRVGEETVAWSDSQQTTVSFRSDRFVVDVTAVRTDLSVEDVAALARRALELLT